MSPGRAEGLVSASLGANTAANGPDADRGRSREPWTKWDTIIAAIAAVIAVVICAAAILRRPDLTSSGAFVFADAGVNLLLAQKLAEGARLYRDIGFSYGPLGIHPYEWFSRVFGNTPQAYSGFLATFSVLAIVMAYGLLRRHVSRATSVLVTAGGLFATLLLPGSLIFGVQSSPYFVLERVFFLGVLLAWRPPEKRRWRSAIAVGLLLGAWQGLRFGTALFLGAAVVVVDLLALYRARADRPAVLQWLRVSLVTLAAFLVAEGMWALYAFASLPAADARDFLWPAYVLDAFDVWPSERRWPAFGDVRLFVGQQLMPIACIVLGAMALWWLLRDRRNENISAGMGRSLLDGGDLCLLIPFVFYALGVAGLFRSVYHFNQYAWTLPLAAALPLDRGRRFIAVAFLIVSAPGLALMLRANLLTNPPPDLVTVRPPNGGRLALSPVESQRVAFLHDYATRPVPRSLLIMHTGAGFHALFGTRAPGRQTFYILGFARGNDADAMLRTLETEPSAFVLTDHPPDLTPSADPCTWYGWLHFTPAVCSRIAERIDVSRAIRVDETTWIIPGRVGPVSTGPVRAARDARLH